MVTKPTSSIWAAYCSNAFGNTIGVQQTRVDVETMRQKIDDETLYGALRISALMSLTCGYPPFTCELVVCRPSIGIDCEQLFAVGSVGDACLDAHTPCLVLTQCCRGIPGYTEPKARRRNDVEAPQSQERTFRLHHHLTNARACLLAFQDRSPVKTRIRSKWNLRCRWNAMSVPRCSMNQ